MPKTTLTAHHSDADTNEQPDLLFHEDLATGELAAVVKLAHGDADTITPATAAAPIPVQLGDGTNQLPIRSLLNGNGVAVLLVDEAGSAITSAFPVFQNAGTLNDTKCQVIGMGLDEDPSLPLAWTLSTINVIPRLHSGGTWYRAPGDGTNGAYVQVRGDALTALQLLDDAIGTDAAASPSKGQMIVGHDGTNARRLAVDASGHPQVDVLSSALPSGAATEAKQDTIIGHIDGVESALADAVTALQSIDDWDEVNRAKVNLIVGQAGIAAGAGAVGASTPRVTLASDDPAVALLTTIDVDTGSMATSLTTLAGTVTTGRAAVNPISGQAGVAAGAGAVGATTQRMTLASDDPAVALLGTMDADTGSMASTLAGLDGCIKGPGEPVVDSYTSVAISAAANTANQQLVAAPGANKQIWVYGIVGTADTGDGSISLQDEDDAASTGVMEVFQRGGFAIAPNGNFAMPFLKLPTNKALEIDAVTCGFKGVLQYGIVDVS